MGWRSLISREAVSGSLQSLQGFGLRTQETTSKLKFPNQAADLPQPKQNTNSATLTPVGRTVQATTTTVTSIAHTPRYFAHAAVIALAGAIVLGGSVGHAAHLSTVTTQGGYGSVLDQAAAADVAAKVAGQANLIVAKDATTTASTLNSQVSMVTSGDDTLAPRQVVDTAGAVSKDVQDYKVQPGDTLGSIAAKFNITSDTIRWANSIDGDTLKPGQSLVILPISGIRHTVAAGETADSLASKFQSNAEQIVAFNDAEVKGLQAGATIIIPDGVMPQAAKPAAPAAPVATSSAPHLTRFAGNGNGYAFGYCTYYVASRRSVPGNWGNAVSWYYNAQLDGFSVGSAPVPGAIAWTGAGYYGHVAYVESVSGGNVTVSEMNYNGNWDRVTYRTVPASSFRYIY